MSDNSSYLIASYGITSLVIIVYMFRTFIQLKKVNHKLNDLEQEPSNES